MSNSEMSWGTAIENLLWSLAALVAVVFGNGEHDLISIVLYDKTAYRCGDGAAGCPTTPLPAALSPLPR